MKRQEESDRYHYCAGELELGNECRAVRTNRLQKILLEMPPALVTTETTLQRYPLVNGNEIKNETMEKFITFNFNR
jgi:hypothetical protein